MFKHARLCPRELIIDCTYGQRKHLPCLNRPKTTLNIAQIVQTFDITLVNKMYFGKQNRTHEKVIG